MNNIWIVALEPIDQRYTKQWYDNIPELLTVQGNYTVSTIDGLSTVHNKTTKGAFLDFAATNTWKAEQVKVIAHYFENDCIKPGDKFLVTDAWHFGIIAIRYMSELLGIPVEIHSIWHAGAYDPTDILGMKMSKPWPWSFEQSVFHASDYNYFATNFHRDMFLNNLQLEGLKAIRSGQPHDQVIRELSSYNTTMKDNMIVWPHRYNVDKQPDIMEDLQNYMYYYSFIVTQNLNLTKSNFYHMMARSKIVFSCALHENLGISVMEATLLNNIPVVPDRASYKEMYLPEFKYPSEWTESFDNYVKNKERLTYFINERMFNYNEYSSKLEEQKDILSIRYMTARIMINNILRRN